ncbi:Pentatricopeptide repeat-containing protein [Camellia lanceoleosa]|uniref:Pentatricopeptide repeat-containing protein n=1 Tax=Camellia lanceoleosa TaxID=1840588 RepID=A0ACC0GH12_9ERIC|nr:Pentatricopeptide repeat-containing protein [Camellia lanceoleosa]
MKLRQLHSLPKPLHQLLYLPLNLFIPSPHFVYFKRIQTFAKFGGDQNATASLSFNEGSYFAPTSISYSKLLSLCCQTRSLSPGLQIHAHLTKIGLDEDTKLQNHLINLYSKCRAFGYAHKLIDESPQLDLISWSALISGYAQNGLADEALLVFYEMHLLGVKSNEFTFPSVLKACSITRDLIRGKQIHGIVVVTGFESDVFVANTLVVMYAKCGEFVDSRRLFDEIPERNVVSWNALFSCYVQSDFFLKLGVVSRNGVNRINLDEYSLSSILNAALGWGCQSREKNSWTYNKAWV